MKQRCVGRLIALVLSLAMVLSLNGFANIAMAAKSPKISAKKVTLEEGKSKKVTIKNKPAKAKVIWKSKNKKIATVKNGKIKAVKAGSTKVTAKVSYKNGKKKVTKNFTVKVTVKAAQAPQPAPTDAGAAATVAPTAAPTATSTIQNLDVTATNVGEEHASKNGITTKDNGIMRPNLTALEVTKVMGLGWNLGNALEESNYLGLNSTVEECEMNAGNTKATQRLFDGLKTYGINTIRIPVAWSNLMSTDGNYTINEGYFNRVEEVFNYCLNNEMYVIINIHWDGGWWGMFGDEDENVRKEAWKKYEAFWTQISERYKEYSDHLIFEGANEELGERLNDDWEGHGSTRTGVLTKEEYEALTMQINQKFVDIVRASGGNNKYRLLLIPGINTNTDYTCSDAFTMPTDIAENGKNRMFVSMHYYDPIQWGISKSATESYGYVDTWGSEEDYAYLQTEMDKMYNSFVSKGYGVILGECGVVSVNKDGIPEFLKALFNHCKEKGYVPCMWDEGTFVDRRKGYFVYEDVGNVFAEITGSTPKVPSNADIALTGKPQDIVAENQNPMVVSVWEGDFLRNTGSGELQHEYVLNTYGEEFIQNMDGAIIGGMFRTNSVTNYTDNKLTETCAKLWWHAHFQMDDWSKIKEPCVRITMHDDEVSQTAQLQLVYSDGDPEQGAAWRFESDFEQVEHYEDENGDMQIKRDENGDPVIADTAWIGKVLNLNPKYLEKYPVLLLTTNTYMGADFVKVEICDAAYNADGTEFVSSKTDE